MNAAAASGDFERCIALRGQIKPLKIADLQAQMQAATLVMDFETCMRLKNEITALQ